MRRLLLVLLTLVVGVAGGLALAVWADVRTFPGVDARRTSAEPAATATVTATATATETVTATPTPTPSPSEAPTLMASPTATAAATTSAPAPTSAAPSATAAPAAPAGKVVLKVTSDGSNLVRTSAGFVTCYLLNYFGDRSVECLPEDKAYADPKKPSTCEYDWAAQFTLTDKATYGVCRSDANDRDTVTVLRPGQRVVNGPLSCRSATDRDAIECRNARTGHGFTVTPQDYRLF